MYDNFVVLTSDGIVMSICVKVVKCDANSLLLLLLLYQKPGLTAVIPVFIEITVRARHIGLNFHRDYDCHFYAFTTTTTINCSKHHSVLLGSVIVGSVGRAILLVVPKKRSLTLFKQ